MGTCSNHQLAAERTTAAQEALLDLDHLLPSVLEEDHTIDWDQLKISSPYPIETPRRAADEVVSREPDLSDLSFRPRLNFLTRLIPSFRKRAQAEARARFFEARGLWLKAKEQLEERNRERFEQYKKSWALYEAAEAEWLVSLMWVACNCDPSDCLMQERDKRNAAIDESRNAYLARKPEAISEYCKMVLNNSRYPDMFPCESLVDYVEETRTVVVDYSLPDPSAIPTLKEMRYIAAREAFREVHVTEVWLNRTYDSVLYQIALRSLYELFQADIAKTIESAVFNGWVNSIDKATGKEVNACVLSIHSSKTNLMDINLAQVDPKPCFRKLKGVSAAKLTALQPVRPLLLLNREDPRFVASYGVVETLDASSNLAAMDWEDFEHLMVPLRKV